MKLGNDYVRQIVRRVEELEDGYARLTALTEASLKALETIKERLEVDDGDYYPRVEAIGLYDDDDEDEDEYYEADGMTFYFPGMMAEED